MGKRRDELLERAALLPELLAHADRNIVALKAQGARIYDIDNVGYIDYTGGAGAAIVGYGNQFVLDAVRKVLLSGVPDGLHVPQEVELAESLGQFVPWVGSWWFCRNQDEAMRLALRWTRERTGRRHILKLDGGAQLFSLESCGDGGSPGQDTSVREIPGWDMERIEAAISGGASKLAAVVIDVLMTRHGVIPAPVETVRNIVEQCRRAGVLVVLDERVSGFRIHRGGAAAWAEVTPDVAVYGRTLGGGFPIGALAVVDGLVPTKETTAAPLPVPHPVSLAAAEAVLSILKNDTVYERLESRTEQLIAGLVALTERFSRPLTVNRVGSVFSLYMSREPVDSVTVARQADTAAYRRFADALLLEGVLIPPEPLESAFLSNAHGAKEVEETLAACERVLLRMHQEDLP